MLRKAGNFLRYLFGILMMLAGAGYWKEEKAYALSLLLLGIFLLPVTWNTIKKLFASGYLEYDKETVSCGESTSCAASCVAAGFRLCADTCDVQQ